MCVFGCRIDWHSAHFGFPGKTYFYTSGIEDRYIRIFRSNPPRDSGESLDVLFAISSNVKDEVLGELVAGLNLLD